MRWHLRTTKPFYVFEFFIPHRPRPKQRDLVGRRGVGGRGMVFPNPENKPEADKIRHAFIRKVAKTPGAADVFPHTGPVRITCLSLFRYPKDWWEGKEFVSAPDTDNLTKLTKDALHGAAWLDDRFVVGDHAEKGYWRRDGTVVVIELYPTIPKPTKKRGRKKKT